MVELEQEDYQAGTLHVVVMSLLSTGQLSGGGEGKVPARHQLQRRVRQTGRKENERVKKPKGEQGDGRNRGGKSKQRQK